jgi:hypothetical protein
MNLRIPITIAAVVAAGVGLVATQKYIFAGSDIDFTDREFWKDLVGANDDTRPANPYELIVLGRMGLKDAMARKLVHEEITLEQAAARFVEVNKDNKAYYVGLDCNYRDVDTKEAVYRDVLKWVETLYENDPAFEQIRERLDKQFEDCRKRDFPLPPVPLRPRATAA